MNKTPNARRRELGEAYTEQYREAFVKDFTRMTDGWGVEMRDELLKFFEEETSPSYWLLLRQADEKQRVEMVKRSLAGDPEAVVELQTFRGEAESQLAQWHAARAMKRGTEESKVA